MDETELTALQLVREIRNFHKLESRHARLRELGWDQCEADNCSGWANPWQVHNRGNGPAICTSCAFKPRYKVTFKGTSCSKLTRWCFDCRTYQPKQSFGRSPWSAYCRNCYDNTIRQMQAYRDHYKAKSERLSREAAREAQEKEAAKRKEDRLPCREERLSYSVRRRPSYGSYDNTSGSITQENRERIEQRGESLERLRQRREKGIKVDRIAQAMNVSRSTVYKMLKEGKIVLDS